MTERSQNLKSVAETALAGLQTTLTIVKDVSGSFGIPGLQTGLMGLELILQLSQQYLANDDRISRLLERIINLDAMLQDVQHHDRKLPPQLYHRVVKIVRLWEAEASKVAALRERSAATRWITARRDADLMQGALDTINQSIQDFLLECAFNTEVGILRLQHDMKDLRRMTEDNLRLMQRSTSQQTVTNETTLMRLDPKDSVYLDVVSFFNDRWIKPKSNPPKIKAIYQVYSWSQQGVDHYTQYSKYRTHLRKILNTRFVEEPLFHTHPVMRACTLGDDEASTITPCLKSTCSICHMFRGDFSDHVVRYLNNRAYWGHGFYFTSASNKGSFYLRNTSSNTSPNNVLLLSKVLVGIPKSMAAKDHSLRRAPDGTHSIKAVTMDQGGVVTYSERVVYRPDAICPWVMIVY